jgi:hypothetical protein
MAVQFALSYCTKVDVFAMGAANEKCQKYSMSCRFDHHQYKLNDYHDFAQEWRWYCKLHESKRIWLSTYDYLCTRR